jgi:hypothetical protein
VHHARKLHALVLVLAALTPTLSLSRAAEATSELQALSPRHVPIDGTWTGQAPGPNGEIEIGENRDAGLMNGTFVVLTSTFENVSANGSFILHHEDLLTSATRTHLDANGRRVPDTIHDDITVTVIADGSDYRFTFIGRLFDGTGVFDGADGYYTGDGTSVPTPHGANSSVAYYAGTIGGELRLR